MSFLVVRNKKFEIIYRRAELKTTQSERTRTVPAESVQRLINIE